MNFVKLLRTTFFIERLQRLFFILVIFVTFSISLLQYIKHTILRFCKYTEAATGGVQ